MPKTRIKRVTTVVMGLVILAMLGVVPSLASEEWKVLYGWTSGYGGDDGVLISSDGRVGLVTDQLFDQFDECQTESLGAEEVAQIQRLIDRIPDAVPANSHTRIVNNCHDGPEHFVVVSFGAMKQAFQYSKSQHCMSEIDPPQWLANLVEHLEMHYERLRECKTVSTSPD